MTPEQWAHQYDSPPSFTACGHYNHTNPDVSSRHKREGESTCRDCGHSWNEYPITLSDLEYDTLLAYMAFRLDSK